MSATIEHIPTDMTVTVAAEQKLSALQATLAKGGQWLPIDPPGDPTLADLLAYNLSGPRRFGYGTIRDYVIGLKTRLADGRVVKSGGKVVKNVAGYDVQKLFIGAAHTLGQIVEVTLKVRPRPEMESFVEKTFSTLPEVGSTLEAVLESPITPIVLDVHNVHHVHTNSFVLVLGFDGSRDEVEWQWAQARDLGVSEKASVDYTSAFGNEPPSKLSVLPSKLMEVIARRVPEKFVARAGNGILYFHGPAPRRDAALPVHLWQRAKAIFDPKGVFPSLPS